LEWNFVHSNFFGVDFECAPNLLEWTWSALQKFWSGLEVHSKTFVVDFRCTTNFWSELWVHDGLLQGSDNFWSGKLSTRNILEWTASHSKKIGVHTFPLQIGVHEVKSWSAFSLTQVQLNQLTLACKQHCPPVEFLGWFVGWPRQNTEPKPCSQKIAGHDPASIDHLNMQLI
jgi:hypothetical protein